MSPTPALLGQQTPGTKRLLKHIDDLRFPKLSNNCGQLLRSSQNPGPPDGVVHGRGPPVCSVAGALPDPVTNGGRPRTSGAILSVTLRPNTFLLIV